MPAPSDVLRMGERILALPIVHGSGDFALEVRRTLLDGRFDCVAVPLPPSFQRDVERAVGLLPAVTLVTQAESGARPGWGAPQWRPPGEEAADDEAEGGDAGRAALSYVPIDPCQGVIAALRVALQERIPRAFVDLETARFEPYGQVFPDPYALKRLSVERFAAGVLPSLGRPPEGQPRARIETMAARLRALERRFRSILFVCSLGDWPWIREAYRAQGGRTEAHEDDAVAETRVLRPDPRTLLFLLGELPFITGLYERARSQLESDENLSVDGVKALLLVARDRYRVALKKRARRLTPHLLALTLRYVRNLSLIDRRLTPDLYTLVVAAKQIGGDQFAVHVAETARDYAYALTSAAGDPFEEVKLGIDALRFRDGEVVSLKSRLPGPPVVWRTCELTRPPGEEERFRWQMGWNPFSQCSWPPEDHVIESFRNLVQDRAQQVLGTDLARTEKFTTSVKDGIDMRETLRNWHKGEIHVKVLPPARGRLDCVVMLFDSPADPRDYPWRITWVAEHEDESTLALFATDFRRELVGPGIGLASYGGALFLFPPRPIREVWSDRRLDFATTLEERLLAAACVHSACSRIALLSALPPGAGWRRLARRFGKRFVHVPLSSFSQEKVQQLRMVHVLNGHQVRSYAAHFIRKA